ncbi:MAG: tRNA lysidine(34) synthetase TilS [Candidatus Omnitrophota bacterium]
MLDRVKETLIKYSMIKKGMRVLLCVSGGPDSVAMLHALNSMKKDLGIELIILHMNHKLRGIESDRDEDFVKSMARRLRLQAVTHSEDIKKLASDNKRSLEDMARRARYGFFLKAARDLNADLIATAHTRDDQAETLLMRLLRGSGLRGLRGILPKRSHGGTIIIRPLIDISRREIESYLKRKRLRPRIDSSNLRTDFFRNKVRLKLIPLLEKDYSPKIKELLYNLSQVTEKDYEYLNLKQDEVFKRYARKRRTGAVAISLKVFKKSHLSLQRAFVRKAVESLTGSMDDIDFRHSREIENLVYHRPVGSIVHMPSGVECEKSKSDIIFFYNRKRSVSRYRPETAQLSIPGKTVFGRKKINAKILSGSDRFSSIFNKDRKKNSNSCEFFDMDKLKMPLKLRYRYPGDRMRPFGMRSHKKISDIFIDEKIPLSRRKNVPLVVSSDGDLIWLCGMRMSDKFRVSEKTKRVLKLEFLPN